MKKVLKNVLLAFIITYTILSITSFIASKITFTIFLGDILSQVEKGEISDEIMGGDAQRDKYKEIYGENAPSRFLTYLEGYSLGTDRVFENQITVLVSSIIIGGAIGILISLSDKSKMREIILFIVIGIILALGTSIFIKINNSNDSFIDILLNDVIKTNLLKYVLIYLIVYFIRYLINQNRIKKLNNELKK